ncbi:DUF6796 family protein [Polaribacter sp.]|uniref:DUF6796 family protein n=1 Tax=Polaribacter sp. TaxID=1920175 RepID=UPI003EF6E53F
MQLTKNVGYLGLLGAILVGVGEFYLHYSPHILESSTDYEFFKYVSLKNLTTGHFLSVIGLPFYFAGYIHIYRMLKSGNETLARIVLGLGFVSFAIGGIWIGSRASIGNIVHLKDALNVENYKILIDNYTNHLEVLVKALRIVIALLSIVFVIAILKGKTYYKKWMAIFSPIAILLLLVILGKLIPSIGKYMLPILMNVTHFILFSLSLYQLNKRTKNKSNV